MNEGARSTRNQTIGMILLDITNTDHTIKLLHYTTFSCRSESILRYHGKLAY